jgi:hypothetical protein
MSNVIRFPGYFAVDEGYWHGCQFYENFKALVRDLSERDRERTRKWHVKREWKS